MSVAGIRSRSAGRASPDPGGVMPLLDHLRELRKRLAVTALAMTVGVVVSFVLWEPIYDVMREPYCTTDQGRESCDLFALGIFEQLKVRIRVALIGGVLLSSPVWLYELGAFITPALHRKERRYVLGFLTASLLLFAAGTAFAYATISRGLQFLLDVGGSDVQTLLSIQSYLSFVTLVLLAFGVAFEFPVVVVFLHLVGALPAQRMRRVRRHVVLCIFAGSALITPSQDPVTFLAMAMPLCLMYEGCVLFARFHERLQRRRAPSALEQLDPDTPSAIDTRPTPLPEPEHL